MASFNSLDRSFLGHLSSFSRKFRKKSKHISEFACLSKDKLRVPPLQLQSSIREFTDLQNSTDSVGDYRNAFFFQFSSDLDGVASFRAKFGFTVPRAVQLMDRISPYLDLGKLENICCIGSHCGAEILWLCDNTDARITGIEENKNFAEFSSMLTTAYGLQDRVEIIQSTAEEFVKSTTEKFDLVILHGLLYMAYDPIQLIDQIQEMVAPDGQVSIEIWALKGRRPVMEYISDGSGWGDTFGFTVSFLQELLPSRGLQVEALIMHDFRPIFLSRKRK